MSRQRWFFRAFSVSVALAELVLALPHAAADEPPATGSQRDNRNRGVHVRPLLLGSYASFNASDRGEGGMIITLPLGIEWDIHDFDCVRGNRSYLKVASVGLYGPGLNWAGFANRQAWSPAIVSALKVSAIQYAVQSEAPTKNNPEPSEWVFGLGFLWVFTGDLLAVPPTDAWKNGQSVGLLFQASYTPAGL